MNTSKITPHPALYETINVPNSTTQQFTSKPLKQNKSIGAPYSKEQFNRLLTNYQSIPKESHSYDEPVHTHYQLALPRIPGSYIPISKHYKLTRTNSRLSHPILLRNKYNGTHSFQHRAAQYLVAQNLICKLLHVFDDTSRKESINSL